MNKTLTFNNTVWVHEWYDDDEDRRNYNLIDRMRFLQRISNVEKILLPILTVQHRQKVYCQRYLRFLIIDIQGFNTPDFSPKEMSIMDSSGKITDFLFKSSIPFNSLSWRSRRGIRWLENNHINIKYSSSGHVNPKDIDDILYKASLTNNTIYVKGHQKCDFLNKYLYNVVEIVNLERSNDVPKLEKTNSVCLFHNMRKNRKCVCTHNNVKILYDYVCRNFV